MQVAYSVCHQVRPPLPQFTNALIGHAVSFLARLGFVLPTSVFGFVFVARRPEFEISAFGYLVILLGLFSLYCYVRDLERPGLGFHRPRKGPRLEWMTPCNRAIVALPSATYLAQ